MSRFNKDHVRIYLESADSPMFSTLNRYMGSTTNSPISDLAHNLSGACLDSTPRRRLSMASIESNTPTPLRNKKNQSLELVDSGASLDLPLSENRILKQSPKNCISGKAASGPSSTRTRVIPWRLGPCHGSYDKENISSSSSDATPGTNSSHDGSSSILSLVNSPPSKRLGQLLASPLRARHPLEDYDPNSQDSGYGNSLPEAEECRALESSPSLRAKLAPSSHIRASKKLEESETTLISENSEVVQQHVSYSCTSTEVSVVTSPNRVHPRTLPSGSITPGKKVSPLRSPRNLWSNSQHRSPKFLHSHSSGAESIDDGFLEFFELEKASTETITTSELPSGIGNLLSGAIVRNSADVQEKKQSEQVKSHSTFRRSVSLVEGVQTPPSSRVRLCLFREEKQSRSVEKENVEETPEVAFGFKRPEPPEGLIGPARCKRRRFTAIAHSPDLASPQTWAAEVESSTQEIFLPPVLQRSISDSEAVIKRALQRSSTDPDLIGDFTRPYSLPLISGRHQDLKTISSDTLAGLLRGEFDHCVHSFHIIDCRYPYEYEGGHIRGAKNLFTKDQILKELMSQRNTKSSEGECSSNAEDTSGNTAKAETKQMRDILVFHCEFSSERGPSLSRFLRNSDRARNKECYPALHYPEIYLLHGGYKAFFDKHCDLCEPCSYLPMADPRFESDLRSCRAKSKSWTGGVGTMAVEGTRVALRGSLKRLGL